MADKKGRIRNLIKKNLSQIIIYEMKTPLTQFVSITNVDVSPDYSYCNVYVSDVESEKLDSIVAFLNNNKKPIRSALSKTLDIYKTPELRFFADRSFEEIKEIDDILKKATTEHKTLKDVYGKDYKMND